jgi:2,4-dienoyl-CoA reductase-like NADH-dependent reductase (Old Yellow Enzyme family)
MAGQIGVYDDKHIEPLARIAALMKQRGNVALMQINHGGLRANATITGTVPLGPYAEPEFGGRAMSTEEIRRLIEDYIRAAQRVEAAGFDGVEVHGAHAQIMAQFLDPVRNQRADAFGGSAENRARLITEVLSGIRQRCGPDFLLGLRLSVERYEINLAEFRALSKRIMVGGFVDYLDMSLWDCFKEPEDRVYHGKALIEWALDVERGKAKVGVAGKIRSAAKARACIEAGADFVILGRAAILHDDFPLRAQVDPDFAMTPLPVSTDYLHSKGVSDPFIGYLKMWDGFVANSGRGMYTELGTMVEGIDPVCFATDEVAASPKSTATA